MKGIQRSKKGNLYTIVSGLCNITDGLVGILSLGFYRSNFTYEYVKSRLF